MKNIIIYCNVIEKTSRNSIQAFSASRAVQLKLQYSMNKGNS